MTRANNLNTLSMTILLTVGLPCGLPAFKESPCQGPTVRGMVFFCPLEGNVNILQITPADGWYAVCKDGDEEYHDKLVSWALVEDEGGSRWVEGLYTDDTGAVELASTISNFDRYEYEYQPNIPTGIGY